MTTTIVSLYSPLLRTVGVSALALSSAILIVACGNSSGGSGGSDGDVKGLGDLPGGGFSSSAFGVSADGTTVVGESLSTNGTEAFRWTSDGGMTGLGDLPRGLFFSAAHDVSSDGSVVVGKSNAKSDREAYRWTVADGIEGLGDLPGGDIHGDARAITGDGSVAVGRSDTDEGFEAFRWNSGLDTIAHTPDDVILGLGDIAGGYFSSKAHGVSGDGAVVVGRGNSAPFIHSGANDPATEGWTMSGSGSGIEEGESTAGALAAWFINDDSSTTMTDSTLGYVQFPSDEQITETNAFGWKLEAMLRLEAPSDTAGFSVGLEFANGATRYSLAWGVDVAGQPIVLAWDGVSGNAHPPNGQSFNVGGVTGAYHLYELVFDPTSKSAALFVDGNEQISDYVGHTFDAVATGRRVAWGSLSNADIGHAEYNYVGWGSVDETVSSRREAFRWDAGLDNIAHTVDDHMHGLGDLQGGEFSSEAMGVSADGVVAVGVGASDDGDEAFRWEDTGTCTLDNTGLDPCMVALGDLPGGPFRSVATAASADGSVVVGFSNSGSGIEAFIWDSVNGMQKLSSALAIADVDPGDWTLTKANDVSDNGTVIVGEGMNPDGDPEAWMVVLP